MNLDEFGISGVSTMRFPVSSTEVDLRTSDPYKSSAQSSMSSHLASFQRSIFRFPSRAMSVGLSMFHHERYERYKRKERIKFIILQHPSEIMPSFVRQDSAVKSIHFIQATRVLPATQHHLSKSY